MFVKACKTQIETECHHLQINCLITTVVFLIQHLLYSCMGPFVSPAVTDSATSTVYTTKELL